MALSDLFFNVIAVRSYKNKSKASFELGIVSSKLSTLLGARCERASVCQNTLPAAVYLATKGNQKLLHFERSSPQVEVEA